MEEKLLIEINQKLDLLLEDKEKKEEEIPSFQLEALKKQISNFNDDINSEEFDNYIAITKENISRIENEIMNLEKASINIEKNYSKMDKLDSIISNALKEQSKTNNNAYKNQLQKIISEANRIRSEILFQQQELDRKYCNCKRLQNKQEEQIKVGVPPSPPKQKKSIEYKIGGELFGFIGAALILIAIITLGKILLPVTIQGISLYLIPIVMLFFGYLFEKKFSKQFSQLIDGLGIASAYIVTLINYQVIKLFSPITALIILAVITLIAFYLSRLKENSIIRIISLIGFYIAIYMSVPLQSNTELVIYAASLLFVSLIGITIKPKATNIYYQYAELILNFLMTGNIYLNIPMNATRVVIFLTVTLSFISFMMTTITAPKYKKYNILVFIGMGLEIAMLGNVITYNFMFIPLALCPIAFALLEKKENRYLYLYPTIITSTVVMSSILYNIRTSINLYDLYMLITFAMVICSFIIIKYYSKTPSNIITDILNIFIVFEMLFLSNIIENPYSLLFIILSLAIYWFIQENQKEYSLIFIPFMIALTTSKYFEFILPRFQSFIILLDILSIISMIFADKFINKEKQKFTITINSLYYILILFVTAIGLFNKEYAIYTWETSLLSTFLFVYLLPKELFKETKVMKTRAFIIIGIIYSLLMPNIPDFVTSLILMTIAAIAIYIGFYYQDKFIRTLGLVLSLVTILKMMTIDFHTNANVNKIILFLIGGILMLLISYIYMRIDKKFKNK